MHSYECQEHTANGCEHLRRLAAVYMRAMLFSYGSPICGWLSCIAGSGVRIRLAIAVAPVWVWVAVISALPHKEERFLFPVYTLVSPDCPFSDVWLSHE